MFFANDQRDKVREENPGIKFGTSLPVCLLTQTLTTTGEVGKMLGEKWKTLSEKQRQPYEAKAAADKKRYEEEKEAYAVRLTIHVTFPCANLPDRTPRLRRTRRSPSKLELASSCLSDILLDHPPNSPLDLRRCRGLGNLDPVLFMFNLSSFLSIPRGEVLWRGSGTGGVASRRPQKA